MKNINQVGYVFDDRMLLHEGKHQFENPDRIVRIHQELNNNAFLPLMIIIPSYKATREDLLLAHDAKYIDYMDELFTYEEYEIQKILSKMDSMFGNKNSLLGAKVAAGCTLNLMKAMLGGEIKHGIANVRSPGHHAHRSEAKGFCFFNNVAIAAKYAIKEGKRVVIVDFDIHANDGVLDILQHNQQSLLVSINRYDNGQFWPGTGKDIQTNNVLSIGLNDIGTDDLYYKLFNERIMPKIDDFKPDIIIVSAGFDAALSDPLGGYQLTPYCYYNLIKMLLYFKKPILLVLEGGYNLNAISKSMSECTRALLEDVKLL